MTIALNKLLALVNADNTATLPQALTETQVTVGAPAVNTNDKYAKDTKVELQAIPGVKYRGKVTVYYNRIKLDLLFKNINANVGIDVQDGQTTDDLIPLINAKYGTDFEVGDLVVQPLVTGSGPRTVELAAVESNLAYSGTFTLTYDLEAIDLDSVVLVLDLNGFNYPNADTTKGQGAIYSYDLDGSTVAGDFWSTVAVGAVDETFVTPFNTAFRVDEDWIFDDATPSDFNLAGAMVVFNGVNDPATVKAAAPGLLLNPTYNNVCVMQLDPVKTTNLGGYLTVYHGGKVQSGQ